MGNVGKAFVGVGIAVLILGGCCLDSEGVGYIVALATVGVGIAVIAIGYGVCEMYEHSKPTKKDFYEQPRKDWLDGDLEIIENGEHIINLNGVRIQSYGIKRK